MRKKTKTRLTIITIFLVVLISFLAIWRLGIPEFSVAKNYGTLTYSNGNIIVNCGSFVSGGNNDCVIQSPLTVANVNNQYICESFGGRWLTGDVPPCLIPSCESFENKMEIQKAQAYCNNQPIPTRSGCVENPDRFIHISGQTNDVCTISFDYIWQPIGTTTTTIPNGNGDGESTFILLAIIVLIIVLVLSAFHFKMIKL